MNLITKVKSVVAASVFTGTTWGAIIGSNEARYRSGFNKITVAFGCTINGAVIGAIVPFAVIALPVLYPMVKLYDRKV